MQLKVKGLNQAGGGMRKGTVRREVPCNTEETEGRCGWHGGPVTVARGEGAWCQVRKLRVNQPGNMDQVPVIHKTPPRHAGENQDAEATKGVYA